MVYINILKDSEYYADNFEERIITKNNCTDLISSAIKVFYGYICDTDESVEDIISKHTDEMLKHAQSMEFEKAAELRDKIKELEKML